MNYEMMTTEQLILKEHEIHKKWNLDKTLKNLDEYNNIIVELVKRGVIK
jgi:hypothetical protein